MFRVPSALELTPEKFHDFLSLASSPSLVDTTVTGSPDVSAKTGASSGRKNLQESPSSGQRESRETSPIVGSPPAPSFAQVGVWCGAQLLY